MTHLNRTTGLGPEFFLTYEGHLKRVLDILFCILVAPIAIPLIGVIALIVKLDGGAAFYSQVRLGKDGTEFQCWKIRTMVPNADALLDAYLRENACAAAEWRVKQKLADDPRITSFGGFLRRTSLDELPQLLNIFLGEMSLVGPRPMLPQQRRMYGGSAYFLMRPGLTGFWQVSDRSIGAFEARVEHDERYFRELSLVTDLMILIRTVRVVFKGTGV